MLDEYYTLHGWDLHTSWPKKEKLDELNLKGCVRRLDQVRERRFFEF
jgi:aldehyde:ferredoxin oxidoreductase